MNTHSPVVTAAMVLPSTWANMRIHTISYASALKPDMKTSRAGQEIFVLR